VRRAAALALALAALGRIAHADVPAPHTYQPPIAAPPPSPPDPAATEQATDANFDEDAPHHGFRIAAAIGPGVQLGGVPSSTGGGGGLSLRLGAAASRRVALLFAVDLTTILEQPKGGSLTANTSSVFSLGPQVYLREALWVRAGVGIASFQQRVGTATQGQHLYGGPGGEVGVGVDFLRRERFAMAIEVNAMAAIYRDGFVGGGFLGLGLQYD
jgi:hypothetical protein